MWSNKVVYHIIHYLLSTKEFKPIQSYLYAHLREHVTLSALDNAHKIPLVGCVVSLYSVLWLGVPRFGIDHIDYDFMQVHLRKQTELVLDGLVVLQDT